MSQLFERCRDDGLARAASGRAAHLAWGTAIAATNLLALPRFLRNPAPRLDGTFEEGMLPVAYALRRVLGQVTQAPDNPFVIRAYVRETRYRPEEWEFQLGVANARGVTLFKHWGVSEEQGDRVLFFGWL
jgi:hypothetical protein